MAAAAALALVAATGWAQAGGKRPPADALASFRVGQWIRLEGTSRGAATISCTGLRQLAGDFLDDDWALRGAVQSVDPESRTFVIAGCRIQVTEDTSFENRHSNFTGIHDLKPGMVVDVEGTFVPDRGLVAAEVDDESDEVAGRPDRMAQIEIVGRIQKVDTRHRLVSVMGVEFQITDKTKVRSVIR
jgi:hypothetical protein